MNAICIGCPLYMTDVCDVCGVTHEERDREEHDADCDEEECLDDWPDERDPEYEQEARNDND